MTDKDRERRRIKRLAKQKKKRATASRPGTDGPMARIDVAKGREWPTGECYVSDGWDEPGAELELVFSRARPQDGISVMAVFEIDRRGPGIVACRSLGGMRQEQVVGECGRLSERSGRQMVACAPALVAALVDDARKHGSRPDPAGLKDAVGLLAGITPMELPTPFGPETPAETAPTGEGWLGGLRKRLFGG
jgi:hypothetical protein